MSNTQEILKSALSLWWLRPENGMAIASYCLRGADLRPRGGAVSVDHACGDGVNTFFKCGGRFTPDFDLFSAGVHKGSQQEIVAKKIDVFDAYSDDYAPGIARKPDVTYTLGTDHKSNLLAKADKLGFYKQVVTRDLSKPWKGSPESQDLVYCNSLYWIPNPEAAYAIMLQEMKPGAVAIFDVMTAKRPELWYENLLPATPPKWQALMNRGRNQNNPGIRSEDEWAKLFAAGGQAVVEDRRDIFPYPIALTWNVGLRPLFPALLNMVDRLSPSDRLEVKTQWVDTCCDLLLPLLEKPEAFGPLDKRVRVQFVVRKKAV